MVVRRGWPRQEARHRQSRQEARKREDAEGAEREAEVGARRGSDLGPRPQRFVMFCLLCLFMLYVCCFFFISCLVLFVLFVCYCCWTTVTEVCTDGRRGEGCDGGGRERARGRLAPSGKRSHEPHREQLVPNRAVAQVRRSSGGWGEGACPLLSGNMGSFSAWGARALLRNGGLNKDANLESVRL